LLCQETPNGRSSNRVRQLANRGAFSLEIKKDKPLLIIKGKK